MSDAELAAAKLKYQWRPYAKAFLGELERRNLSMEGAPGFESEQEKRPVGGKSPGPQALFQRGRGTTGSVWSQLIKFVLGQKSQVLIVASLGATLR